MNHTSGPLVVRKPELKFDSSISHSWFGGSPYASAMLDSLSLLLPMAERFMIRAVKRQQDRIKDPALLEAVKGFAAQEGAHSSVHAEHVKLLTSQGKAARELLELQARDYRLIEKLPQVFQLALAAAFEHFTAVISVFTLKTRCHEGSPPALRDLWYWHAAEEIEHKSVVYDLLKTRSPWNYPMRILAYALALHIFRKHVRTGINLRIAELGIPDRVAQRMRSMFVHMLPQKELAELRRELLAYLRPGFHPEDSDDRHLARDYFASARVPTPGSTS